MVLFSSSWSIWLAQAVLSNAVVALLLAIIATMVGWRLRRPAMAHGLWVLVLIKLVTPPIIHVSVPVPAWMTLSRSSVVFNQMAMPGSVADAASVGSDASSIRHDSDASSIRHVLDAGSVSYASSVSYVGLDWLLFSLIAIWLSMALFLMVRSLLRSIRFACVLEAEGMEQIDASKLGQQMAKASGVAKCPRIRLVAASLSPMLFGFSKWATIVIPARLWNELNNSQRRAMLAHELSHFRRCDHWVRALELIVGSLFFWFPLVRIARVQIERMEETCCDLNAVDALEKDRRLYAESLLHVVDYISQRGGRMPGLASGMRPTITLEERLRSIMNDSATGSMSHQHRSVLGIFGLCVVLVHPLASASPNARVSMIPYRPIDSVMLLTGHTDHENSVPESVVVTELPAVPCGWWNETQLNAVSGILAGSSGQTKQLRINPGSSIDVVFADATSHRLAEPAPSALVALHQASRLIIGNTNGDIRLWDVDSQQSVSWIGRHEGPVTTLCYHPKFGLLSGDTKGLVLQWEIQSGAIQNSWSSNRGPIQSIRCDTAGERVAILFGDWKNHIEYSHVVLMSPSQWTITGANDVSVVLATIFDRMGSWNAVDWNGNVYQYPFFHRIACIPKSSVSAIAFSQDAEMPAFQSVPVESQPFPFKLEADEL